MDAYEVREIVDRWTIPIMPLPGRQDPTARPVAARAQGAAIFDADGRRHLDFGSGPAAAILGHNHPRYIDAIKRRLHAVTDNGFLDADALELHRRLGETLTPPLQKSLLLPYREAAIQAAIDIARAVTGGTAILTVSAGRSGTMSFDVDTRMGWVPGKAAHSGHALSPFVATSIVAPYGASASESDPMRCGCTVNGISLPCLQTAFELTLKNCGHPPAALILDPFIGDTGIIVPTGYASTLRKLCHHYGMLFIMDESATGFGRTGRMWAHQHEDIVPDIIIVAGRFGAGLSIHAVCAAPDIAEQASVRDVVHEPWHDPVACAAATAAIDVVREEKLVARAAAIGGQLQTRLKAMAAVNPVIGDVRGRGAMYAIELAAPAKTATLVNNTAARMAVRACRSKGLLLREQVGDEPNNIVHIAPPLVSTSTEIDEGMDILADVLRDVANIYQIAKPVSAGMGMAA